MTPNAIAIAVLVATTLIPFTLIFVKLDELLIWLAIIVVCWWAKVRATF
jgi:hypothetical protein